MIAKNFFLIALIFLIPRVMEAVPQAISLSAGIFDLSRTQHRTASFDLEYQIFLQSDADFLEVRPLVGVMATADCATYLFAGLNLDFSLCKSFVLAPGFGLGWFQKGHGKNLGFPLEFRSLIEMAWQWSDHRRLGVRFSHLSNAGFGHRNPGEETIDLFYSFPIRF